MGRVKEAVTRAQERVERAIERIIGRKFTPIESMEFAEAFWSGEGCSMNDGAVLIWVARLRIGRVLTEDEVDAILDASCTMMLVR